MLSQKCTYGNNNNYYYHYYFNSYYSFNGIYCFTDVNVIDVNDLHDDNGFDSDNDSIDVNRVSDFNNFNDVNVKKCEKLRKYSYRKLPNFRGETRRLRRPLTANLCNTGGCSMALQTGKELRNNICHDW